MAGKQLRVGIIGCGNIAPIYLKNIPRFDDLKLVAVADAVPSRAVEAAKEHKLVALTADELIASKDIDIVLDITPPGMHATINKAALAAGKHVYTEKSLAVTREDGKATIDLAESKGLRVGCAPDTVLGGGYQTCRKLIDQGAIGKPVSANAFFASHGPERWHPDPAFFYAPGGGPLFDMGPYYLTALTLLLGPVRRVSAMAQILVDPRTIGKGPKTGQKIQVTTPDHIAGVLEFENGAIGTLTASFATWFSNVPRIEIHGTEGSLLCPDPNTFIGPVALCPAGEKAFKEVEIIGPYGAENWRGLGLADMAKAIVSGRAHRATGKQAFHVLDIMHSLLQASQDGRCTEIKSSFGRPDPMPADVETGRLD